MSGHSWSDDCPNCQGTDTNFYQDHKPFQFIQFDCLECGMYSQTTIAQMDIPELNQTRKDYGDYDDDDLDQDFIQNGLPDEDMEEVAPWQQHYRSLEERVQRYELEQAKSHLENVLGEVSEKYPSVPRQAILQHIIDKPPKPSHVREKVFELAERYTSYIVQVEEAAIARHLESLQAEEAAAQAAPRPTKKGGAKPIAAVSAGDNKPKSLKDAKDSLYQFMKDTNPFG